ncbi:peroxiredoxin [uncultured Phycicoccus sp.]|uniref:peroxiredoxin n=1 Tax=uncultured Phycicoccus sp. TaxID=661422 RepID=UPI002639373C|nr:peroxiredoxin [uncultured Phycicoccus sp.]
MTLPTRPLSIGDEAPDFTLRDQNGADVSLSALTADRNVVVVFYPWAFSGICTGELDEIRDHLERFVSDDLQVVCISCDAIFSVRAWADIQGYFFPLLSDAWPHGAVARAYGVLNENTGAALRGTFLVDRDRRIAWTLINETGEQRDFSELPTQVAALAV